jgi:dolichol-phosphate mannosyltransferase
MTRISVVVPYYNEVDGMANLAAKLSRLAAQIAPKYELECVLVDDGSVDGSEAKARTCFADMAHVIFVRHDKNQGLGAGMRTGFANATGEIVTAIDSDCTYDPQEIPRLVDALESNAADISTASPYHPEGGVENVIGWRLFLSRGASWMYGWVCACKLYTYTSMMRAYRRNVVQQVRFESDGFAGVTEILLRAASQGYHIVEVPMVLHSRQTGVSKMRVARSMWMHLRLMAQALAWRFTPPVAVPIVNPNQAESLQ